MQLYDIRFKVTGTWNPDPSLRFLQEAALQICEEESCPLLPGTPTLLVEPGTLESEGDGFTLGLMAFNLESPDAFPALLIKRYSMFTMEVAPGADLYIILRMVEGSLEIYPQDMEDNLRTLELLKSL